jgi:hypothetical protein
MRMPCWRGLCPPTPALATRDSRRASMRTHSLALRACIRDSQTGMVAGPESGGIRSESAAHRVKDWERTCIATATVSPRTDQPKIPNPFVTSRFGFETGTELTGRGRKPIRDHFAHDVTREMNASVGCLTRRFGFRVPARRSWCSRPPRLREVSAYRRGAPSRRATRCAQTFF